MGDAKGETIAGILGQYASGRNEAVRALIRYLGGERQMEEDGTQRLDGKLATVWLRPGEDLNTLDRDTLRWEMRESVVHPWLARMRVHLGHQIRERSAEGKPVIIEAGFGENPLSQTLSHLFARLEEAGVGPERVKWILVEADFDKRAARNAKRRGPFTLLA